MILKKKFSTILKWFWRKKSENIYDDLYKKYELTDEFYSEDNLVNDGKTMYNVMKMFGQTIDIKYFQPKLVIFYLIFQVNI